MKHKFKTFSIVELALESKKVFVTINKTRLFKMSPDLKVQKFQFESDVAWATIARSAPYVYYSGISRQIPLLFHLLSRRIYISQTGRKFS